MKRLLLLLPILLAGCSVSEQLSKQCQGSDIEMGCNGLFGSTDNEQQTEINTINARISSLESQNFNLLSSISTISTNISILESQIQVVEAANNNLSVDLTDLQTSVASYIAQLAVLANTVHQNTANIATLQSNHNVTKIIDPCNDAPNKYDEVFFRLSSGKIVASFSDAASGLNTRFAELKPGTYSSTDGTLCNFTVSLVSGQLIVIPSVEY